ncbi:Ger(x)C family spore germination C-terminal domain-containing protein [Paenibacillus chondroitinus]|uniref:Ger(X)C family spore germination C-terminal domain-containing protein n=1 Tax=Paenibacillus chondroitinus TaxID=59842 RepID=A0ABU6D4P7_9BACL|nr:MULTISPECIES: Ger(x)C family spore germination C-terminal domain-containing protein [Paenibacillus]MCY9658298.1 Ger(x)C family spore germination C-terminal domain-containing protein [Paenibacillus anseongense]MEB4792703.1 Ger(x)C family spore germination C-terminal domain-containing protein [Paenibacillus chondroitinus]
MLGKEGYPSGVESSYVVSEYLFNFYRKKKELGLDPILSIVESANNRFTINTAVVFDKKNVQLTLNSNETHLFNIIKASINKVEIEAPFQDSKFFVSVDNINSKYHILIPKNGPPYIDMHIKMRGVIEESASVYPELEFRVGVEMKLEGVCVIK